MPLSEEEKEDIAVILENEGFDYAFVSYSSFEFVDCEKFHKLRKKFLKAREDFENFLVDEGVEFE